LHQNFVKFAFFRFWILFFFFVILNPAIDLFFLLCYFCHNDFHFLSILYKKRKISCILLFCRILPLCKSMKFAQTNLSLQVSFKDAIFNVEEEYP